MRCLALLLVFAVVAVFADTTVYFSPKGGCEQAVVSAVNGAQKQIRVQAYSFTSKPIITALVAAHTRGVDVKVILDHQWNTKYPQGANALKLGGVDVRFDGKHPIAHNKVCVVDSSTIITGSYNFTAQANLYNAENLLVIQDAALAGKYLTNWTHHAAHSDP
jgi:phosphatidylserine/phosphatidylglycerophosphate/cardiolipin synthase-like enzyme